MSMYRTQSIEPKNGVFPVVLNPARISGCRKQKEASLEDQHDHGAEVVSELWDGEIEKVEFRLIATKGKGEDLTRPELAEIEAQLRTGEIDLLILDDIGRLVRGTEANRLIGIGVDFGTRTVAPNDYIDTDDDSWEEDVISACRDHVGHNSHTSKRLKQKLMNRFKKKGQATPCQIAGYIKPKDAKSYHDWFVDQTSRAIVLDGAKQLRQHLNCSALADYLNTVNFDVGPYCRNTEWNGAMVRRYYSNPILKGKPERGNMHSVKHHETGKRRSVKNPEGPVAIELPHLAILPDVDFDELNALLKAKNSNRGRKPYANGIDPLKGVPRKRTRFPGQHASCWYCGRNLVWGGNGIKNHMQCTGSRLYKCWNSIGIDGGRLTSLAVGAVWKILDQISGLDEDLFKLATSIAEQPSLGLEAALSRLKIDEAELAKQEQNLLDVIAKFGPSEIVEQGLKSLPDKKLKLKIERAKLQRQSISKNDLPESTDDLKELVRSTFLKLAQDSYEFGQLFPKIVPEIFVYCVRLCTGGPLLPRARITVDLSGAFEGHLPAETQQLLVSQFDVDIFDRPRSDMIRGEVVDLNGQGVSKKTIGELIAGAPSLRMINQALGLQQALESQQIADPYVMQLEPPADLTKLRRYRHPRYVFETLENYQRPTI